MTAIEIILAIVAVLGLALAYQAHHNGLSISAEAKADIATAKADATGLVHDIELRVVALETKVGLVKAAPPTPAPAPAPAAPTTPAVGG